MITGNIPKPNTFVPVFKENPPPIQLINKRSEDQSGPLTYIRFSGEIGKKLNILA